ncbi:MAG: hypothetical protein HKN85_09250, partial [Gammaproteobacteria bacterium]|nr:hypothetical protein [Gammaproteobacteria bacterium]
MGEPVPAFRLIIVYGREEAIAGPAGAAPNIFDELVYPAFLVNSLDEIEYETFTKVNIGDQDGGINHARARWEGVAAGTYRACVPRAIPVTRANLICTEPIPY